MTHLTQDDIDLSYRKILCASIEQAVKFAKGDTLYTISVGHHWREDVRRGRSEAIDYIFGAEFEYDMALLGLEGSVSAIRRDVENALAETQYQPTLKNCNEFVMSEQSNLC